MKDNVGYWEYDPVIYPRKLWVAIGQSVEDIKGWFVGSDGSEWEPERRNYDGLTLSEVERRDNGEIGELVVFGSKKDMTMCVCVYA